MWPALVICPATTPEWKPLCEWKALLNVLQANNDDISTRWFDRQPPASFLQPELCNAAISLMFFGAIAFPSKANNFIRDQGRKERHNVHAVNAREA